MKKKILLGSGLALVLFSGCSQQENTFEIAKAHVWGDKYNGCDYQTMEFFDNEVIIRSSDKRTNEIAALSKGATGKSIYIKKIRKIDINSMELSKHSFITNNKHGNAKAKFIVNENNLQFDSVYLDGAWNKLPRRKGMGNQTDFIVCDRI